LQQLLLCLPAAAAKCAAAVQVSNHLFIIHVNELCFDAVGWAAGRPSGL